MTADQWLRKYYSKFLDGDVLSSYRSYEVLLDMEQIYEKSNIRPVSLYIPRRTSMTNFDVEIALGRGIPPLEIAVSVDNNGKVVLPDGGHAMLWSVYKTLPPYPA